MILLEDAFGTAYTPIPMMVHDARRDGLNALQRHRERRKAFAAAVSNSNRSLLSTCSTRTNTPDSQECSASNNNKDPVTFPNNEESSDGIVRYPCPASFTVRSILETSADREEMWNMSELGFNHPEDVAHLVRRVTRRRDSRSLIVPIDDDSDEDSTSEPPVSPTEDPTDSPLTQIIVTGVDSPHDPIITVVDPPPLVESPTNRRRVIRSQTLTPRTTRKIYKHQNSASYAGVGLLELRKLSQGSGRSSTIPSTAVPSSSGGGEQSRRNRGSKVGSESTARHASRHQSTERDPPRQVGQGMVVEATPESHGLMRRISVLGMSDPVYGDVDQVEKQNDDHLVTEEENHVKDRKKLSGES